MVVRLLLLLLMLLPHLKMETIAPSLSLYRVTCKLSHDQRGRRRARLSLLLAFCLHRERLRNFVDVDRADVSHVHDVDASSSFRSQLHFFGRSKKQSVSE